MRKNPSSIKKVFKLDLSHIENYKLIAIHSNISIFSLVYQLNKYCFTEFVRSNDDLKVDHKFMIPLFNWKNEKKGISFELFENKFMVEDKDSGLKDSLFSLSISKELSLIESHKEVDFFIKQNCFFSTSNLIEKMSKIQNISLIYRVPNSELSKNFNFDL
ncbi:MAG: IPExxxVDY family protein [Candidatus Marisimplicoccus sp.]